MEVFFKNLTSDESPTERLVEDIMMLVAETEDLVNRTGANLGEETQVEIKTALERVKLRCQQLKNQALAGARHTDQFIRQHPYPAMFMCFGAGVLLGLLLNRKSDD